MNSYEKVMERWKERNEIRALLYLPLLPEPKACPLVFSLEEQRKKLKDRIAWVNFCKKLKL